MVHRAALRFGLVALAAIALAGCGRKGALELPPDQPAPGSLTEKIQQAQSRIQPINDNPGLIQPPNKIVQVPAKDKLEQAEKAPSKPINGPDRNTSGKKFVLDPLL